MDRHYILFDTPERDELYPFTHTRPAAEIRTGILTIREKWERWLGTGPLSSVTAGHLQVKFPLRKAPAGAVTALINGHLLPSAGLVSAIAGMEPGEELYKNGRLLAKLISGDDFFAPATRTRMEYAGDVRRVDRPWDIVQHNDAALRADFALLTEGRQSAPIPPSNQVVNPGQVFLEPGAKVECSVLNASAGPIYVGRNAEIMEGNLVRGPFAMGEGAVLKMGSRIYGATTLGPKSVAGGEIKNTVFFAHSNKGHDGYLGDAVIGEWCNLGANTSCSNMKNNAREVRIWMEAKQAYWPAGPKCGVLMGDYSRCGINTMFNTGTVVGVSCNVFGGNFPPKYLPSFSWGGAGITDRYRLDEALRDAGAWMRLKGAELSEADREILRHIFRG